MRSKHVALCASFMAALLSPLAEAFPQSPVVTSELPSNDQSFPELPPGAYRQEETLQLSVSVLDLSTGVLNPQKQALTGEVRTAETSAKALDERTSALRDGDGTLRGDQEALGESTGGLRGQEQGLSDQAAALQKLSAALEADQDGLKKGSVTIEETEKEVKIGISADVLFDFNKWGIRPDAVPVLQKVMETVRAYSRAPLQLDGHTDSVGSDEYNQDLSLKRAKSVAAWFVHRGGVAPERITTHGLGESRPVAPNTAPDGSDSPQGRQKNRRVELRLIKQ